MSDNPTWEGLGQGMLVLAALWWAWGAYAWLTNYIAADEGLERLLMFAVMGAFLVVALAMPRRSATTRCCSRSPTPPCAGCTSSSSPRRTTTWTRPGDRAAWPARRCPPRCC